MPSPRPPLPLLRRRAGLAVLGIALAPLASCGSPRAALPLVVAGDGVLCDLSRTLAAGDLKVECLLAAGDDPHEARLRPQQKRSIAQAQLVLINGYGLTPALARLEGAIPVAEIAVPQSLLLEPGRHHGADPRSGEPSLGDRDPHVWHDPAHTAAMVSLLAERLSALEPTASISIARRRAAMEKVLQDLDRWNRAQLATMASPPPLLASGHRAFASYAAAYGLRELPLVDDASSTTQLRPEGLREVVAELRRQRVPRMFTEPGPVPKTIERISRLSGVPIAATPLVADGLAKGSEGSLSTIATAVANTCAISQGLGGRCDQASGEALIKRWQAIR